MTVRTSPDLYRYIYDNRGDHQYYANPADEFRGHDERPRSDPRDNDPYWGIDRDQRDRSNDDYDLYLRDLDFARAESERVSRKRTLSSSRREFTKLSLDWYFL